MEDRLEIYFFQDAEGNEIAYKTLSFKDAVAYAKENKLRIIEVCYAMTPEVREITNYAEEDLYPAPETDHVPHMDEIKEVLALALENARESDEFARSLGDFEEPLKAKLENLIKRLP